MSFHSTLFSIRYHGDDKIRTEIQCLYPLQKDLIKLWVLNAHGMCIRGLAGVP